MKKLDLKLISICSLFVLFTGCSSLQETRRIETKVSDEASEYLALGDRYRVSDQHELAIDKYEKAAKLYISKLNYLNYALVHLKIANIESEQENLARARHLVEKAAFCQDAFQIDIKHDLLGAYARMDIAAKNYTQGKIKLKKLIAINDQDTMKKTYYMAMLLKIFPKDSEARREEIESNFSELFLQYKKGTLINVEGLVYIGKGLLDSGSPKVINSLELIANDLEVKSLAHYLLDYRKRQSQLANKVFYNEILKDLL